MKVTYLTNERKIERKLKELWLSRKLNKVFDKKKILELYLNKIFF
jgi:membrane carboxypeptidase/penicillin-binding protein